MSPLIGHDAALAAFRAAVSGGALHHAWLIAGPEGIGKALFARTVAAELIGGGAQHDALIAAGTHPDLHWITREVWDGGSPARIVPRDDRKDGDAVATSIRIAQIRALQPVLAKRPALGARRAIVIDAIDDLAREGANALLKNLEEPPQGTVFLLVSHAPGRLLPTIRSRCRTLRLNPLSPAEVERVLADRMEGDAAERAALVAAAEGAPGRALRYAGLDLAGLEAALARIAADGDPDNAERLKLARALSPKAAQARYELFLERSPRVLAAAARTRGGEALRQALDLHAEARDLAAAAMRAPQDVASTVIEMAGIVARLSGGLHPGGTAR